MISKVLQWPNPILEKKAAPVLHGAFRAQQIADLIRNLEDTAAYLEIAGLAAPQIGHSIRVFVVANVDGSSFTAFINPSPVEQIAPYVTVARLACCPTLPGYREKLHSYAAIKGKAYVARGVECAYEAKDSEAHTIQQMIDCLDGKTILDRIGEERARIIKKQVLRARRKVLK